MTKVNERTQNKRRGTLVRFPAQKNERRRLIYFRFFFAAAADAFGMRGLDAVAAVEDVRVFSTGSLCSARAAGWP